jgi:anthranilate synthase component 2
MKPRILLIDNYDSFTYNLDHYLQQAGAVVTVRLNDACELLSLIPLCDGVVISPGPSSPAHSGLSAEAIRQSCHNKALLGVCLGMQIINEVFGGQTIRAPYPVHGKVSTIRQAGKSALFDGVPPVFNAARYHSLVCAGVKTPLQVSAWHEAIPMALEHERLPLFGLQFHPESFLTEYGRLFIDNFVRLMR